MYVINDILKTGEGAVQRGRTASLRHRHKFTGSTQVRQHSQIISGLTDCSRFTVLWWNQHTRGKT